MTIKFEKEDRNGYEELHAVSQLEIYRGRVHDELFHAEIRRTGDTQWRVVWQDDWQHPVIIEGDVDAAKQYVRDNYSKHTPHSNGATFRIDEL